MTRCRANLIFISCTGLLRFAAYTASQQCVGYTAGIISPENWLKNYEYQVSITMDVFILLSVVAMAVTLVTIGFQTLKAAPAYPVERLKTE